MRNPETGQLYLLSNLSPHQLKRRYALWSWFHITMFFGGVGGAVWVMMHLALSG
jgi:cell division septal protein FtsQ